MDSNYTILVAGATPEETTHIKSCLLDCECVSVPLNVKGTGVVPAIPVAPILMMVFAQKNPKNTLAVCEQLRETPEGTTAPILLVINRYEIIQFNELRRCMENIAFIMTPFSEEGLRAKIAELRGTTN